MPARWRPETCASFNGIASNRTLVECDHRLHMHAHNRMWERETRKCAHYTMRIILVLQSGQLTGTKIGEAAKWQWFLKIRYRHRVWGLFYQLGTVTVCALANYICRPPPTTIRRPFVDGQFQWKYNHLTDKARRLSYLSVGEWKIKG